MKADNKFANSLQVVTAPYDRVFPSEKDNTRDFEDNCKYKQSLKVLSVLTGWEEECDKL